MRILLIVAVCIGGLLAGHSLWAQAAVPAGPSQSGAPLLQAPLPAAPESHETARAGEGAAASGESLTLAELEQMALACNPTLAQAAARVQAARGLWVQAGLYPNPSLAYSAEDMGDEGTAGKQGAIFGQEFVTAGKLPLNREVAAQEVAAAECQLAAQRLRVLTDVRLNYYRAAIARQRVDLAEQLVGIAQEGVNAAETLLKNQEASRVDLLQTRIQRNAARIMLFNAHSDLRAAREMLAAVVGVSELPPRPVAGHVEIGPPIQWEGALARLLAQSPELSLAAAELQRARWVVQRAYAGRIPNVEAAAVVSKDNASGDTVVGVEAGIAVPIFDRNQGNIARAQALVVDARRNVDRIRFGLQARLSEAFRRYTSALNELQQYRDEVLPDAKAALDLVRRGYQAGEFGYLALLGAQRTYFQTNLAYLDALLQVTLAGSVIEGSLLSGSLGAEELPVPDAEAMTAGAQNEAGFTTGLPPAP